MTFISSYAHYAHLRCILFPWVYFTADTEVASLFPGDQTGRKCLQDLIWFSFLQSIVQNIPVYVSKDCDRKQRNILDWGWSRMKVEIVFVAETYCANVKLTDIQKPAWKGLPDRNQLLGPVLRRMLHTWLCDR